VHAISCKGNTSEGITSSCGEFSQDAGAPNEHPVDMVVVGSE
jgi:hypothetical protein